MLRYILPKRITYYFCRTLPFASLSVLLALVFLALNPPATPMASAIEDALSVQSMSVSLEIGGAALDEETSATRNAVSYRAHTVTINATDIENYTLTISGPTNLTGPTDATTTITGAGVELGSNLADNTWGYAYGETTTNVAQMTFSSLTGTESTIDSGTPSSNAVNQTKNLVFAAKFGPDATYGEYTADVILSLVTTAKAITYTLSYDANNGSNAPGAQTVTTTADSYEFTVAAQGSMARSGYTFLGWGNNSSDASATYTAGSSKITLTKDSPTKTLYAVWKQNIVTLSNITNMNQLTTQVCKNTGSNVSKSLKDTSSGGNNRSYTVTKLKDGNCWMATNMNNSTGRTYEDSTYGGYYSQSSAVAVCTNLGGDWRLPSRSQYENLTNGLASGAALMSSPYNFLKGGYYQNGTALRSDGWSAHYWTTTFFSGTGYYLLKATDENIIFDYESNVARCSVRCLVTGS